MTSKEGSRPAPKRAYGADKTKDISIFEQTDASPRAISWAAVGLLVLLVLASLIVMGTRYVFSPSGPNYRSAEFSQKHLFEQRKPLEQAAPGVAIQPRLELQNIRKAETQKLSRYEWSDSNQAFAKIPIARAMEIIVAESRDSDASEDMP